MEDNPGETEVGSDCKNLAGEKLSFSSPKSNKWELMTKLSKVKDVFS